MEYIDFIFTIFNGFLFTQSNERILYRCKYSSRYIFLFYFLALVVKYSISQIFSFSDGQRCEFFISFNNISYCIYITNIRLPIFIYWYFFWFLNFNSNIFEINLWKIIFSSNCLYNSIIVFDNIFLFSIFWNYFSHSYFTINILKFYRLSFCKFYSSSFHIFTN